MASNNYISPTAFLPKLDTGDVKVPAGLAAQQNWDMTRDYKDQFALSKLGQQMDLTKQGGELGDYFQTRDSKNLSDIATNQATAATVGDLKRGQADLAFAQGNVARQTMGSDISTKLAENVTKQGEQGYAQFRKALQFAAMASQLQGPQAAAQLPQMAQQMGVQPQVIQMAMRMGPQKLMELLMATDEKLQGDIAKEDIKGAWGYDQAERTQTLANEQSERNSRRQSGATLQAAEIAASVAKGTDHLYARTQAEIMALQRKGQQVPQFLLDMRDDLARQQQLTKTLPIAQRGENTQALMEDREPRDVTNRPGQLPQGVPSEITVGGKKIKIVGVNADGTLKGSDGKAYKPKKQ